MPIDWPDELIEDIARRRAILYLGAGVSASATSTDGQRPPDWITFLNMGRKQLRNRVPSQTVKTLIEGNDLLTACELLKEALDEKWPTLLQDCFQSPKFNPSPLHKAIHNLDVSVVLTPNFDTIYDRFADSETQGTTVTKVYYDDDIPLMLRRNRRTVIKVHGSIHEPSKMIFTRQNYAHMRATNRSFFELIDALFLTQTFVFIGTSLNDPDLNLFLENHRYSHPQCPPHYMTSPKGEVHPHLDQSIRNNLNLKLLRYDSDNNHQELINAIDALAEAASAKRQQIAMEESW